MNLSSIYLFMISVEAFFQTKPTKEIIIEALNNPKKYHLSPIEKIPMHACGGTPLGNPLEAPLGAPMEAPPLGTPLEAPLGAPLETPLGGAPLKAPMGAPMGAPPKEEALLGVPEGAGGGGPPYEGPLIGASVLGAPPLSGRAPPQEGKKPLGPLGPIRPMGGPTGGPMGGPMGPLGGPMARIYSPEEVVRRLQMSRAPCLYSIEETIREYEMFVVEHHNLIYNMREEILRNKEKGKGFDRLRLGLIQW